MIKKCSVVVGIALGIQFALVPRVAFAHTYPPLAPSEYTRYVPEDLRLGGVPPDVGTRTIGTTAPSASSIDQLKEELDHWELDVNLAVLTRLEKWVKKVADVSVSSPAVTIDEIPKLREVIGLLSRVIHQSNYLRVQDQALRILTRLPLIMRKTEIDRLVSEIQHIDREPVRPSPDTEYVSALNLLRTFILSTEASTGIWSFFYARIGYPAPEVRITALTGLTFIAKSMHQRGETSGDLNTLKAVLKACTSDASPDVQWSALLLFPILFAETDGFLMGDHREMNQSIETFLRRAEIGFQAPTEDERIAAVQAFSGFLLVVQRSSLELTSLNPEVENLVRRLISGLGIGARGVTLKTAVIELSKVGWGVATSGSVRTQIRSWLERQLESLDCEQKAQLTELRQYILLGLAVKVAGVPAPEPDRLVWGLKYHRQLIREVKKPGEDPNGFMKQIYKLLESVHEFTWNGSRNTQELLNLWDRTYGKWDLNINAFVALRAILFEVDSSNRTKLLNSFAIKFTAEYRETVMKGKNSGAFINYLRFLEATAAADSEENAEVERKAVAAILALVPLPQTHLDTVTHDADEASL